MDKTIGCWNLPCCSRCMNVTALIDGFNSLSSIENYISLCHQPINLWIAAALRKNSKIQLRFVVWGFMRRIQRESKFPLFFCIPSFWASACYLCLQTLHSLCRAGSGCHLAPRFFFDEMKSSIALESRCAWVPSIFVDDSRRGEIGCGTKCVSIDFTVHFRDHSRGCE